MKDMFAQGGSGSAGIKTNKQAIARACNVKVSEVIYSNDILTTLDGKKAVYDKPNQYIWGLPSGIPSGATIVSVTGDVLVYNPGGISVTLSEFPNAGSMLRDDLAKDTGATLVKSKAGFSNTVSRSVSERLDDAFNVKDWGAKGDGVTDDTAAIDDCIADLTGSGLVTNFRRLYFPHGTYVYKGTGMVLPNGTTICGEDLFTIIDASTNTNTGYLVTLTGFGARLETLRLRGNKDNVNFKGISSNYNTDNGGVVDAIIEDFTYGLDIDKSWYSVYQNIRFRRSSSAVNLTGAHIRIGFNLPSEEVNNLNFSNIWIGEPQTNGVTVHCPTQVLTWNECSFETVGGPRILFASTASVNTFVLNSCYIEGGIAADKAGGAYVVEAQSVNQVVTMNDCMFRLGSVAGTLGKNVTIYMNGGWSNSPVVDLTGNNTKVWAKGYRHSVGSFLNGPDYGRSGDYDGTTSHSAPTYLDPRPMDVRDWNSVIPKMVNYKNHPSTSPVPVFKVYVPAGSGSPRMMQLEINALTKSVAEAYIVGNEKYLIAITLPEASIAGTGTLVTKVAAGASSNAILLADPSFTVVSNGYDSATDAIIYTISHAVQDATRLGNTLYTMEGVYAEAGLSTVTRRWKIQRL